MKHGDGEWVGFFQMQHRGRKQGLIGPIVGPAVVAGVDVLPVQLLTSGAQRLPLGAGVKQIHDRVEAFVFRPLGFRSLKPFF